MKKELNISEILKDKPKGTKLYSPIFGDCTFSFIQGVTDAICVITNDKREFFNYKGLYSSTGERLLFPSKLMRDWSKFAWNKGDVLSHKDGDVYIIFEGFTDDTYCSFVGKYYLWKKNNNTEQFYEKERLLTSDFQKAGKNAAQTYINTIEKRLGDKLNMDTLEIESVQPEFKDGDIVCISGMGYLAYGIVKSIDNSSKKLEYYVLNDMSTLKTDDWLSFEDKQILPITETQQIILFDALAKEGKAWDSEKKAIVDLKPKVELKPFDKVLIRDDEDHQWRVSLFGYKDTNSYYCCNGCTWNQCIPYEGNEHLLGTTKNVEG